MMKLSGIMNKAKDQKGKMDNNNGWNQVKGKQNQM